MAQRAHPDCSSALMQECEVNLWVVICSEYNEDPVFKTITPARRQRAFGISCLMFSQTEEKGFRALSMCRCVVNCRLRTVLVTRWS